MFCFHLNHESKVDEKIQYHLFSFLNLFFILMIYQILECRNKPYFELLTTLDIHDYKKVPYEFLPKYLNFHFTCYNLKGLPKLQLFDWLVQMENKLDLDEKDVLNLHPYLEVYSRISCASI